MFSLILAVALSGAPQIYTPGWQFPYAPDPFTVPICAADPCYPTIDANSATMIASQMPKGFWLGEVQEAQPGTNGSGATDTYPVFFSSAADPTYRITCNRRWDGCPYLPSAVHIPNGAHASIDVDHQIAVIDTSAWVEYDFWEFNNHGRQTGSTVPVNGGGNLSVGSALVCNELSFVNQGVCTGGALAAEVPAQPGMIDPREWIAGEINHVIHIGAYCPSPKYVWPAANSDGRCASGPMDGERIWLDLNDIYIESLPVHRWVKTLYHEMHDYGLMVTNSSGLSANPPPWNLYGIDNATPTGESTPVWTQFFNFVTSEGDGGLIHYSNNASHLVIPIAPGISQNNFHVVQ